MTTTSKSSTAYYPFLLFVLLSGLSASRMDWIIVDGIGRNVVWLLLPCVLPILAGAWCSLQVSNRGGGVSLPQVTGQITFKALASVAYLLYALLFAGVGLYYMNISADFFARTLLYGDSKALLVVGTLTTVAAGLFPLETQARFAQIVLLFIMPLFMIVSLTTLGSAHWHYLLPVVNREDMLNMPNAVTALAFVFSPLAALTFLHQKGQPISFAAISVLSLFVAVYLVFMLSVSISIFGVHTAKQFVYITYAAVSSVRLENFLFERVVFIGILLWKYLQILGSGFLLRCAVHCLLRTFGLRMANWHIVVAGASLLLLALNFEFNRYAQSFVLWAGCYAAFLLIVYPIALYIGVRVRSRLS